MPAGGRRPERLAAEDQRVGRHARRNRRGRRRVAADPAGARAGSGAAGTSVEQLVEVAGQGGADGRRQARHVAVVGMFDTEENGNARRLHGGSLGIGQLKVDELHGAGLAVGIGAVDILLGAAGYAVTVDLQDGGFLDPAEAAENSGAADFPG